MIENIVITDKYELKIDKDKNRVYFKIIGFWKDPSDIPNYLEDWRATVKKLKPGFTILSDVRQMKPHSTKVTPLHEAAQKLLIELGLDRTAEVMGNAVMLEFQTKDFARRSSMKRMEFATIEEAEIWLDEHSKSI